MRHFIFPIKSACFGHRNMKILTIYHTEPNVGDNIVEIMYRTLPYNAPPLISRCHRLDPDHSFVTGFKCISKSLGFLEAD